jgi:hypothetical protein
MASLLSYFTYFLMVLLDGAVLLLVLEWFFYFLPSASLNWIRKVLFYTTYPLLKWSDRFFSIHSGFFNSRGLFTAILLWGVSYLAVPWLILFSYSLRG